MALTFIRGAFFSIIYLAALLSLVGCGAKQPVNESSRTVYIKKEEGKYTLYRNGKPFIVKGAAGYTNLNCLQENGGNTIRTWDTIKLKNILDSAQAKHLAVVVGFPLQPSENLNVFYKNDLKVKENYKKIIGTVNRFKNHPALLCWCLGNELTFPFKPNFNPFYDAFNDLVNTIHRVDPNHPVTTTVMSFPKKNIGNIHLRTDIDFISFNIFGGILTLKNDLEGLSWLWNGPFLITEWGIEGPWVDGGRNNWGTYIENTSGEKADEYTAIYRQYMPTDNPRFLGSMVFYWGQKQEFTPTWFSMFDEQGSKTESVNAMKYIWTGKQSAYHAPIIQNMVLDNKQAKDNLLFNTNSTIASKVFLKDTLKQVFTYKWKLYKEDWFKRNGIYSAKKPKQLENLIANDNKPEISLKTPAHEGPYRLFVYVYNNKGYFATANIPFYVLNKP